MVRAGVLPLLHQHLLFGDALQVRPFAAAAVDALAETVQPVALDEGPLAGGSHGCEGGGVVLTKAEMQVFLTAWSAGSAVLAYGAERTFADEPRTAVANPTYRQREAMHSSYDFA